MHWMSLKNSRNLIVIIAAVSAMAIEQKSLPEIVDYRYTEVSSHIYTLRGEGEEKEVLLTPNYIVEAEHSGGVSIDGIRYNADCIKLGGFYILKVRREIVFTNYKQVLQEKKDSEIKLKIFNDEADRLISMAAVNPCPALPDYKKYGLSKSREIEGWRIENYKEFFTLIGMRFSACFFAEDNEYGEIVVLLVEYGIGTRMYAAYGIWEKDEEASKYGYNAGERIYMSRPENMMKIEASKDVIDIIRQSGMVKTGDKEVNLFEDREVAGVKHFKYDEVMADRDSVFPGLWWFKEPLNSSMKVSFDKNGNALPLQSDTVPPIAPDNYTYTTNPPPTDECPDMDTYFALYCDCVEREISYKEPETESANYLDYKDYLGVRMMKEDWDGTVYGDGGTISTQEVSREYQPEEPYLFTKECNLINKKSNYIPDAFSPDARYCMAKEKWGMHGFLQFGNCVYLRDKTGIVKPAIEEAIGFYRYIKDYPQKVASLKESKKKKTKDGNFKGIKIVKEYGSGFVTYGITDSCIEKNIYIGNPADKNNPYEKDEYAVLFDEYYIKNGEPFSIKSRIWDSDDGNIQMKNDIKNWYIQWKWPLVYKDRFGIKRKAGWVKYERCYLKGESGSAIKMNGFPPSGWEIEVDFWDDDANKDVMSYYFPKEKEHTFNRHIYINTSKKFGTDQMNAYSKNSKEWYTDQVDVGERDDEIDKAEALWEIIQKIAVAEGLNLVMKGIYKIAEKKDQAIPLYEGAKRLENRFVQSKTCKTAKELYRVYCIWKQTMDLLAEVRDTYKSISQAWDGLMYAAGEFAQYYKNYDWNRLRLTNITTVLPKHHLTMVDCGLYSLQARINDFEIATDALAFQSDRLTKGNYGPLKPLIRFMTNTIKEASYGSGQKATEIIRSNTENLNRITKKSGESASQSAYLSNITAAIQGVTSANRLSVKTDRVKALGAALYITETESKSWVEYGTYMKEMPAGAVMDFSDETKRKKPLWCLVVNMYQRPVFKRYNRIVMEDLVEQDL